MIYQLKSDTMENADGMHEWAHTWESDHTSIIDAIMDAARTAREHEEVINCYTDGMEAVMGHTSIDTAIAYRLSADRWELHFHRYSGEDDVWFQVKF